MSPIDRFARSSRIAYLSMEIALRPQIHTYSGGLGVLAGDTARSCADLGLPMVFVTLICRKGYLRQEIDSEGRQVDHEDPWDVGSWATPLGAQVAVRIAERDVWIRPWLYVLKSVLGGEVPILLLDTDLDDNHPEDREITDRLYGGDEVYRFKQEIVLGIGGLRILRALGFELQRYHMNEGHAALLALDLLRRSESDAFPGSLYDHHYDIAGVRERCIFTTHTPVEAGHDRFSYALVERLLGEPVPMDLMKRIAGESQLNMTRLALNLSNFVNGVARRHADTTRMLFPGYRVHAITNGVHGPTWVSPPFARLFDRHFPNWGHEPEALMGADRLADDEVWDAHIEARRALVERVRTISGRTLDAGVPILGFARRFTGYKRPDLLFTDLERLARIARDRPFQLVLAGKAHPRDVHGKRLIEMVHQVARQLADTVPMVFLPNYDMDLGRIIVSGPDIWLNTPLPPHEASGTSGMKASLNGVLNLSVLDGWWVEACVEGVTGWAIETGPGEHGNGADAAYLYDKLETVVLPLYFDDRARWIRMMKASISKIGPVFNSQHMMRRYASEAYLG